MEQHQGAMHKPLPTALMNKAFKHFQQDQSENSYGCGPAPGSVREGRHARVRMCAALSCAAARIPHPRPGCWLRTHRAAACTRTSNRRCVAQGCGAQIELQLLRLAAAGRLLFVLPGSRGSTRPRLCAYVQHLHRPPYTTYYTSMKAEKSASRAEARGGASSRQLSPSTTPISAPRHDSSQ